MSVVPLYLSVSARVSAKEAIGRGRGRNKARGRCKTREESVTKRGNVLHFYRSPCTLARAEKRMIPRVKISRRSVECGTAIYTQREGERGLRFRTLLGSHFLSRLVSFFSVIPWILDSMIRDYDKVFVLVLGKIKDFG